MGVGINNKVAVFDSTSSLNSDNALHWDNAAKRLGVGNTAPTVTLEVGTSDNTDTERFRVNGAIRCNGAGGAVVLIDGAGTLLFRGTSTTFGPSATIYTYLQYNASNVAITGNNGATLTRTTALTGSFQVSSGTNTNTPLPVGLFEVRNATNAHLTVLDNGNIGINNTAPSSRLVVNSGTSGVSGVILQQLLSTNGSASAATTSPIGVDTAGEVRRISTLQGMACSSLTTTTTIPTTASPIIFNVENITPTGTIAHSTTTNPTRYTVSRAGVYEFYVHPQITRLLATTAQVVIWLRLNGTTAIANSTIRVSDNVASATKIIPLSFVTTLAINDYVEVLMICPTANAYQLTSTAASGTAPTQIPVTPACTIIVKGYYA